MRVTIHQPRGRASQPRGSRVRPAVIRSVFTAIGRVVPRYRTGDVSVAFVSARESHRLNRLYRRVDRPTDILSFAERDSRVRVGYEPERNYLGELVVAYALVRAQARQRQVRIEAHLAALLVHGFLHLIGFDHYRVRDWQRMLRFERRITRALPRLLR